MAGRLPVYIVPILLLIVEGALRYIASCSNGSSEPAAFIGPTLASIGIGLVVPLTRMSTVEADPSVPPDLVERLKSEGKEIRRVGERQFIEWTWVFLILSVCVWVTTLYLALNETAGKTCSKSHTPIIIGPHPADWFGILNYVLGIILTEAKERYGGAGS